MSPYQYARQAMGVPHTVAVPQNVAVGAAHPSHSGNFRLLVHLLAQHDGPNECATAKSTWCTPQRQGMVHGSSPCMGPIPVSRSVASQGPPHPSVNSARCPDGDCRLGSQCRFKVQSAYSAGGARLRLLPSTVHTSRRLASVPLRGSLAVVSCHCALALRQSP